MRKVIAIGESVYDVHFCDKCPQTGFPGGRILNASASLAKAGVPVTFVSECGRDFVGDRIVDFLALNGVNTGSVDRFTEGTTQVNLFDGKARVQYGHYPDDRFDVVWPRIDEDDILLFGSFYAVDAPQRDRLFEIVKYAAERKAIILYLPGFDKGPHFGITKVMTAILENLELSGIVVSKLSDIVRLFGNMTDRKAYREKIEFYCQNFVCIDEDNNASVFAPSVGEKKFGVNNSSHSLGWSAGFIAGLAYSLIRNGITYTDLFNVDADKWGEIINMAYEFAASADNAENVIDKGFAEKMQINDSEEG